ncbi:MAG TPA: hypothetical protein VHA56_10405 [Mucilaginibacter sp.]|nr:hypothetical protein [Mucilaginibacter sp.]
MVNLLMIDDNPIEHLIVQKLLDKYHLFPEAVHSLDARPCLTLFEQTTTVPEALPDVIFLDLNMPRLSGWDFLDSLARCMEI